MSVLIRQARIIAPGSTFNGKIADILVDGGKIAEIKKSIASRSGARVIEGEDICVSPGWIDLQAVTCDPGYEHRETIESLLRAAAAGGFTRVCVHNSNLPPLHSKAQIEYLVGRAGGRVCELLPMGTVTVDAAGKELSEMYDMKLSGAVGFSDHKHPLADAGVLLRALQYAANIGAMIVAHCDDRTISRGGHVNEGEAAAGLGLRGIPPLAEEVMLQRNLAVLEYAGGRLHVPTVSTRGSVELVKKARAAGLPVTCGVAAVNLCLDDSLLRDFDTNYKVDPPLRSKRDVAALRNAVENGVIDVIVSDHMPWDVECKELEFDYAEPGIASIQTAFGCALDGLGTGSLQAVVQALAAGPRAVLGLPQVLVNEGEEAELTIFSASGNTVLTEKNNLSRSKNSPFFGKPLPGKVIGVVRGARTYFNPAS